MRKNLLVIAGVAAVLILAYIVGWVLYAPASRYRADDTASGTRRLLALGDVSEPVREEVAFETAVEMPPAQPSDYDTSGLAYAAERLIIRTGNISMVVEDTRAALATIEAWVESMAAEGALWSRPTSTAASRAASPRSQPASVSRRPVLTRPWIAWQAWR